MRPAWELAALPGPQAHLEAVSNDLADGFTCVWVLPDELVERGAADDLVDLLSGWVDSVRVQAPQRRRVPPPEARRRDPVANLPSWAQQSLGLLEHDDEPPFAVPAEVDRPVETVVDKLCELFEISPEGDPLTRLVRHDQVAGKVLVLCGWDGWDVADLGTCVTRFTAVLKEHGVSPELRPRLLVVVKADDVPPSAQNGADPLTTRVHWWWDVFGRLDTATVAAAVRRQSRWRSSKGRARALREQVATEVLVEVAGPDLLLADHLARWWDGRVGTLLEQVEALPYDTADDVLPVTVDGRADGVRPPHALRAAWRRGVLDRWDGRVRVSPAAKVAAAERGSLETLVWRGQSRVLTPIVDDCRARLEKALRSKASKAVVEEIERGQDFTERRRTRDGTLELGSMAWAVGTGRVRLSQPDTSLLFQARNVRNALAHLCPLTDEEVDGLAAVLPESLW
ncbi:hypothetical protein AB0A63_10200 [Lentzea sp. NPDC042327]|uniref:hypothetical protein n=1 Tax=Lentzea sp. NPDC042327 TaxID=3154801 RepID=UPI0033F445EB